MILSLIESPSEVIRALALRVRALRLEREWTQAELGRRAEVALPTLRVFERTGKISLERLVRLAIALDALGNFDALFALPAVRSLDELEARETKRQRGRRGRR